MYRFSDFNGKILQNDDKHKDREHDYVEFLIIVDQKYSDLKAQTVAYLRSEISRWNRHYITEQKRPTTKPWLFVTMQVVPFIVALLSFPFCFLFSFYDNLLYDFYSGVLTFFIFYVVAYVHRYTVQTQEIKIEVKGLWDCFL